MTSAYRGICGRRREIIAVLATVNVRQSVVIANVRLISSIINYVNSQEIEININKVSQYRACPVGN